MSKFIGNWILEKSEGFEEYLRATGIYLLSVINLFVLVLFSSAEKN